MLNTKRYNSIKQIMQENGICLEESDLCLYADMFEIIASLTGNKLSDLEMFQIYDILSDAITNKRQDLVEYVAKQDRIKVQLKLMEELSQTKGKLTIAEKQALAFCVFHSTCIYVFNEDKGVSESGLVEFTSVEKIKSLMDEDMKRRPEIYAQDQHSLEMEHSDDSEDEVVTIYIDGNPRRCRKSKVPKILENIENLKQEYLKKGVSKELLDKMYDVRIVEE